MTERPEEIWERRIQRCSRPRAWLPRVPAEGGTAGRRPPRASGGRGRVCRGACPRRAHRPRPGQCAPARRDLGCRAHQPGHPSLHRSRALSDPRLRRAVRGPRHRRHRARSTSPLRRGPAPWRRRAATGDRSSRGRLCRRSATRPCRRRRGQDDRITAHSLRYPAGGDRDRSGHQSRQRAGGVAADCGGHPAGRLFRAARRRDLDPG